MIRDMTRESIALDAAYLRGNVSELIDAFAMQAQEELDDILDEPRKSSGPVVSNAVGE